MNYLTSTIGKKLLVGVAGLGLSLFVLVHMLGNLLIFFGPEAFNKYAHTLTSSPFIYVAEVGLISIFLLHVVLAIVLTIYNNAAKGSRYAKSATGTSASFGSRYAKSATGTSASFGSRYAKSATRTSASFASRTMQYQGIVIFAFLIYHLITFKFGPHYEITYGDIVMRDIFTLVVESFQNPIVVAGYIFTLVLLCMHLSHGLASSLQTLGLSGEKYDDKIKLTGHAYAAFVTLGFMSQPIYVFFFH